MATLRSYRKYGLKKDESTRFNSFLKVMYLAASAISFGRLFQQSIARLANELFNVLFWKTCFWS